MVGSVADAAVVDPLVADCDVVVHFAAESHNDNSLDSPWPFVESNVVGTFTLLEAIRKHGKRLHHISTDEVYGDLELDDPQRFTEATRSTLEPLLGDEGRRRPARPRVDPLVRDPGDRVQLLEQLRPAPARREVHPRQITNILQGTKPKLYGSGLNVRDWIHVDDHNDAVIAILEQGRLGETYLIGADGERNNLEIVQLLLELMGKPADWFEHVNDRPGHDLRYAIDSSKLRAETDWRPRYSDIRAGLDATVAWYRDNEAWWLTAKEEAEHTYARLGR